MIGVDRALVWSLGGLSVRREVKMPYLIGELLSFWLEVNGNPSDVMFCCIGMGYFLSQGDLHIEQFARFYLVWTFYYGNMLLCFPISRLKEFSKLLHCIPPSIIMFIIYS